MVLLQLAEAKKSNPEVIPARAPTEILLHAPRELTTVCRSGSTAFPTRYTVIESCVAIRHVDITIFLPMRGGALNKIWGWRDWYRKWIRLHEESKR